MMEHLVINEQVRRTFDFFATSSHPPTRRPLAADDAATDYFDGTGGGDGTDGGDEMVSMVTEAGCQCAQCLALCTAYSDSDGSSTSSSTSSSSHHHHHHHRHHHNAQDPLSDSDYDDASCSDNHSAYSQSQHDSDSDSEYNHHHHHHHHDDDDDHDEEDSADEADSYTTQDHLEETRQLFQLIVSEILKERVLHAFQDKVTSLQTHLPLAGY